MAREDGAAPANCPLPQAEIQPHIDSLSSSARREHPTQYGDAKNKESSRDAATRRHRSRTSALFQNTSRPARPSDSSDFTPAFAPVHHRPATRHLYNPDDDAGPKTQRPSQRPRSRRTRSRQGSRHDYTSPVEPGSVTVMIRQPEARTITPEQLLAQLQDIYNGIHKIEQTCQKFVCRSKTEDINQAQYQALVALHRSLHHEHHDFLLASTHPSATEAWNHLPEKLCLPERLWHHGIYCFLELLRHKLPDSREHLHHFIHTAYNMLVLLYEIVPRLEGVWMKILGAVSRYVTTIEDVDEGIVGSWVNVSRGWYSKASDKSPTVGRFYHHLAVLARPIALQELFLYAKSLCVCMPDSYARQSASMFFDHFLSGGNQQSGPVDAAFVRVHGMFFAGKPKQQLEGPMNQFLDRLGDWISVTDWREAGYCMGISLCCLLLGFGAESNVLLKTLVGQQDEEEEDHGFVTELESASVDENFEQALSFAVRMQEIILRRWGDTTTLGYIHTTLVFLLRMSRLPAAMSHLEDRFPWKVTSVMLNYLLKTIHSKPRIHADTLPGPEKGEDPIPLPEDYALRGLVFAEGFFPTGWFDSERLDSTERYVETGSKVGQRQERILWIGYRIADAGKWLTWEAESGQFGVVPRYDIALDGLPRWFAMDAID